MYLYDRFDRQIAAERIAQFRGQVRRRLSGELKEDDFRVLRLQNGVYMQVHAYMMPRAGQHVGAEAALGRNRPAQIDPQKSGDYEQQEDHLRVRRVMVEGIHEGRNTVRNRGSSTWRDEKKNHRQRDDCQNTQRPPILRRRHQDKEDGKQPNEYPCSRLGANHYSRILSRLARYGNQSNDIVSVIST